MGKIGEISSTEWKLLSVPDVYYTAQYYEAARLLESDAYRVALLEWSDAKGVVRLPLIIRKVPNTIYFDATSAYGYGGPWIEGDPDIESFSEAYDEWGVENGVICSFLRFHPLLENAVPFLKDLPVRRVGPTAGWSLTKNNDLVAGMSKDHRKTYRRAIRSGLEARITIKPRDVDDFKKIYSVSMDRLAADGFYHFSDDYWNEMQEKLGSSTVMVEAIYEERVVAAAWCLVTDKYLHYHLSGTSNEGRKLGGSVVCRVAAANWGQENGLELAHMGGGVGGADSTLLRWKQKFDEALPLFNFYVANLIHQEDLYTQISSSYPNSEFFPPWRAPKPVDSTQ